MDILISKKLSSISSNESFKVHSVPLTCSAREASWAIQANVRGPEAGQSHTCLLRITILLSVGQIDVLPNRALHQHEEKQVEPSKTPAHGC